ncbi:hypothetical protein EXT67_21240 [Pectobacterium atrosepticum]|uniref:Uncharacterized protein n=1 Tax=Pectobacterium phage phiTE TaxID=1116482 RepID=K9L5N6_9CAUD|nr:hypothetical protein [Pectobacterium atrosepticum]YP_007392643.1 hypothetical protein phiTE_181 [Pectobacterium phage phiTE]AEZ66347.1 hypothetical protein phiTE_181 [Pectobacterium phage phiTE]ARB11681.1 hypothetical protein CB7_228 [Pectobacterium phage vB_PatM_CB7]MCL6318820.1 hypothetical protein [Pectobacterium atrosepticum]
MNINFNDSTFEKMRFLADKEGRSVAAFVSMRMDELAGQLVNTTFTLNEIPAGVQLAHLDPTPRPAPVRNDEQYNFTLKGVNNEDNQRRYAEDQY